MARVSRGAIGSSASRRREREGGEIPERDLPEVFQRLARAAERAGQLPIDPSNAAPAYLNLAFALEQLGLTKK